MHPPRKKRGRVVNCESSAWGPLRELAPAKVGDFTWIHEVELEDGTRLHAYRHCETGRSLYLDHDGMAFVPIWEERRTAEKDSQFEEVDPGLLLELVLGRPDKRAILFRQNLSERSERVGWARSATKHRISRSRSRHALEHCLAIFKEDPPPENPRARARRWVFLGEDLTGMVLEVIAVRTDHANLMVIHAMPVRPRYRRVYEEVRRCNR